MKDESTDLVWHKSSRSNGQSNCVEVAVLPDGLVAARDSKQGDGPSLRFAPQQWLLFVSDTRSLSH